MKWINPRHSRLILIFWYDKSHDPTAAVHDLSVGPVGWYTPVLQAGDTAPSLKEILPSVGWSGAKILNPRPKSELCVNMK